MSVCYMDMGNLSSTVPSGRHDFPVTDVYVVPIPIVSSLDSQCTRDSNSNFLLSDVMTGTPSTSTLDHIVFLSPPGTLEETRRKFVELGFE